MLMNWLSRSSRAEPQIAENIQNASHPGELIQPPKEVRNSGVAVVVTIAA